MALFARLRSSGDNTTTHARRNHNAKVIIARRAPLSLARARGSLLSLLLFVDIRGLREFLCLSAVEVYI